MTRQEYDQELARLTRQEQRQFDRLIKAQLTGSDRLAGMLSEYGATIKEKTIFEAQRLTESQGANDKVN